MEVDIGTMRLFEFLDLSIYDSGAETSKTILNVYSYAQIHIGNSLDDDSLFMKPRSQAGLRV